MVNIFFELPLFSVMLTLLTAGVISFVMIPVIIRVAEQKQLMDIPNGRSSHTNITPSHGGTAIFASLIIAYTLFADLTATDSKLYLLIPALVILFFIGLKDDILVASAYKKLIAQMLAALIIVVTADIRIGNFFGLFNLYELPYLLSVGISIFVLVVVTNAYNLIDGIDGLAGGLGIVAAALFGVYFFYTGFYQESVLCAALIGALAGFLRFNFSRINKIFMGDSGSLVMGFTLGVMGLQFLQLNETMTSSLRISNAPTLAILVFAIPLFDTLRVFVQRILNGNGPFHADRTHIHHFLIDSGFTHAKATLTLTLISLGLSLTGYFLWAKVPVQVSFSFLFFAFAIYAITFRKEALIKPKKPILPQVHLQLKTHPGESLQPIEEPIEIELVS
jgi:UDP-N-acetylmuramyl pentapeptide phosphotransferase/UDP-N-acetylglucosamine-1-phosphate transferase